MRRVSAWEGLTLAGKLDVQFFEASAADGTNVKAVFEAVAQQALGAVQILRQLALIRLQNETRKRKKIV